MTTTRKVKQVYQKGYAKTHNHTADPRLNKVLAIAKKNYSGSVDKLVDLGCGDGFFTQLLAKTVQAKKIYGIDIAKQAVTQAKKLNINAVQMDLDSENLPYPANSIDLIFCGNIIELVADADHLLKEIKRILKKNGVCIVTFPNIASWLSRIALLFGYLPFYYRVSTQFDLGKMFGTIRRGRSTGFIRLLNLATLSDLANLYGLNLLSSYGMFEIALPFPLRLLDKLVAHYPPLASKLICVLSPNTAKITA